MTMLMQDEMLMRQMKVDGKTFAREGESSFASFDIKRIWLDPPEKCAICF
jgi:hypothetical protein